MVSPNITFYADHKFQFLCGCDRILISAHIVSVPQLLQQEIIPLLIGAQKETHCLHLVNLDLLFLRLRLVSSHFDKSVAP